MSVSPVARPDNGRTHIRAVRSSLPEVMSALRESTRCEALRLPGLGERDAGWERVAEGVASRARRCSGGCGSRSRSPGRSRRSRRGGNARLVQGLNPQLGDRTPGRLLREATLTRSAGGDRRRAGVLVGGSATVSRPSSPGGPLYRLGRRPNRGVGRTGRTNRRTDVREPDNDRGRAFASSTRHLNGSARSSRRSPAFVPTSSCSRSSSDRRR